MMKRIAYPLIALLFLLASCGSDETAPASQSSDWTPSFSRSTDSEVRIVGRKNGVQQFNHILIPSYDGGPATWKDNVKPSASKVAASNEFIAFLPAGKSLPSQVEYDGATEYYLDYHDQKPSFFSLYPLMAQLKMHIWVEMDKNEAEGRMLTNDSVYLYTKADIDFPNRRLKNPAERKRVPWGAVIQSDVTDADGRFFRKLSMEKPLVVIPHTLAAEEEILWFSFGNAHYYFKVEQPVELKPGYLASLTLQVTYEEVKEEEGEVTPSDPPTKKVIAVDKHTITITPWEMGETYDETVTTPDN